MNVTLRGGPLDGHQVDVTAGRTLITLELGHRPAVWRVGDTLVDVRRILGLASYQRVDELVFESCPTPCAFGDAWLIRHGDLGFHTPEPEPEPRP